MAEFLGSVYIDRMNRRGVFLDPDTNEYLRDMVAYVVSDPTAAGPDLDLPVLEQLANTVNNLKDEINTGIPLTPQCAYYVELLLNQLQIRNRLAFRYNTKCMVCGNNKIIDPVRRENRRREQAKFTPQAQTSMFNDAWDGKWLSLGLRYLGERERSNRAAVADILVCGRCDGNEFEYKLATYCPECKSFRGETILIQCPDCRTYFQEPTLDIWVPVAEAMASAKSYFRT